MAKSTDHDKAFKVRHAKVLAAAEAKGHKVLVTTQTMDGTTWQKITHKLVRALAEKPDRQVVIYTNEGNPHFGDIEAEIRRLNAITADPANISLVALSAGRT